MLGLSCTSSLRRLVLGFLLMSTSLLFFFTYYKYDFKFSSSGLDMRREDLSWSWDQDRDQDRGVNDTGRVQSEQDTLLLIWMWPFGSPYELSCSIFNVSTCQLTADRSTFPRAHGVLFHHRDIRQDLDNMPTLPRPCFQKWVWSNMESPANSAPIPELNNIFNLTCSYRLDSNIPVPYGYLEPLTTQDRSFQLPPKTKLVCWIVSNWNRKHRRVQYYEELRQHVQIHVYGDAVGQPVSDQDYAHIVSSCKFYLSFENSVHRDYITEKLFSPMNLGSVPVVIGPPRQNYEDHVPADSFIHVDDFSSAKELADRLSYLDGNTTEYRKLFTWRRRWKVKKSWFGREQACRTCLYLHRNRHVQVFHELNSWFWG
ncbi:alpha-(1,3)-fucosyltransferase 9-like isoform X2 [Echeneis naucrates]|uniref:Fucosyltransferase n=2 Tax=Echeneis naucrates TaxID=173247 RepID=A0A665TRT9_ECHNA|nr:alpha-(1,3)-fucosyltransferase 9-like isoform X2 [Echeneis naucrates]